MEVVNWTEVVLSIVGVAVIGILIPLAKNAISEYRSKLTNEQLETLDYWTAKLCQVAEIIFDGVSQGKDKKEWVIDQLLEYGIIGEEDRELVDKFIDAICNELTTANLINQKKIEG